MLDGLWGMLASQVTPSDAAKGKITFSLTSNDTSFDVCPGVLYMGLAQTLPIKKNSK